MFSGSRSEPQCHLPDPKHLGMGSDRSYVLQTIWGAPDILEFTERFGLNPNTLAHTLPRIDVPKGVTFKPWLQRELARAEAREDTIPIRVKKWDVFMKPAWTFGRADKLFTNSVWTFQMQWKDTYPQTALAVNRFLSRVKLLGTDLMFRGTTRSMTRRNISEFIPSPKCADLGPGFYTTRAKNMDLALAYAGPSGVLWVFKTPDLAAMDVVQLGGAEWTAAAVAGHGIGGGVQVDIGACDVIQGPVSEDAGPAALQGVAPVADCFLEQFCFCSQRGFRALGESLVALIYFEEACEGCLG